MSTAADHLNRILELWAELDATPTRRRRDTPRERTPQQRQRARERWEDELTDKLAGAIGRGASPAPCDLDQLQARIDLGNALCELADYVASWVQPAAPPAEVTWYHRVSLDKGTPTRTRIRVTTPDPGHWDYTHRHGAQWACTWLIGALHRGVPPLVEDEVATAAREILRRVQHAIDGQRERPAGRCPCGTRLTVADWDQLIVCTGCGTAYGRRDWLKLAAQPGAA